jgi:hypothetical protein
MNAERGGRGGGGEEFTDTSATDAIYAYVQ